MLNKWWSEDDIEIIKKEGKVDKSNNYLLDFFPQRTKQAIIVKASKLGITKKKDLYSLSIELLQIFNGLLLSDGKLSLLNATNTVEV